MFNTAWELGCCGNTPPGRTNPMTLSEPQPAMPSTMPCAVPDLFFELRHAIRVVQSQSVVPLRHLAFQRSLVENNRHPHFTTPLVPSSRLLPVHFATATRLVLALALALLPGQVFFRLGFSAEWRARRRVVVVASHVVDDSLLRRKDSHRVDEMAGPVGHDTSRQATRGQRKLAWGEGEGRQQKWTKGWSGQA